MAKNAHLTFDERQTIEVSLRDNLKFKEIADLIGKDPSTVSKEIRGHFRVIEKSSYNPCTNRKTCKHYGDICKPCKKRWGQDCKKCDPPCYTHCPDFEKQECLKLTKPPYVCNGCDTRQGCKLKRHLYEAKFAQAEYEAVRSESRQGFATDQTELQRIDEIISPLVKQGQSIHQICVNNADLIMLDEKTIYNYIDAGLLSVGNIDLPRKVRYRVRRKKKPVKVDKQCHAGRSLKLRGSG
ncbi:MAG: helix-turn-helix domain-containing protein [Lachnospiraceae bacterium]|nr:helix-turn-helix domain-containing protein [Lachnospiraceae bacterium]